MNFKGNLFSIIALVGTLVLVSSCVDKRAFKEYSPLAWNIDAHEEEIFFNGAIKKPGNYLDSYATTTSIENKVNIGSFYDVMTKKAGKTVIPSTGKQKLLVIPVEFSDWKITDYLDISVKEYVRDLQNAFFGVSTNNNYVSVSEFYNISSYGKLRLTGKVCDQVYTFKDYRVQDILDAGKNNFQRDTIYNQYQDIIDWYISTYIDNDNLTKEEKEKNRAELDSYKVNKEKDYLFNIPIYLVYDYPSDTTGGESSFFWNYTFTGKFVSWSSYHSLNVTKGKPDSHILIHEVGHLFGLPDYYPNEIVGENDAIVEPVGCIDMMDSCVGDHTGLSKMMLDWVRPYQISNSCELTVKSFAENGDLILLNDSWNGTVFDEFFLLEFYTPTKLNTFDVVYGNDTIKLPFLPGIKLYHVDSTLGYFDKRNGDLKGSINEPGLDNGSRIDFLRSNNSNKIIISSDGVSKTYNNYLYELIFKNHRNAIASIATDEHLYHLDDTLLDFRFNGSGTANYKITITNMNFREATLKFEKLA